MTKKKAKATRRNKHSNRIQDWSSNLYQIPILIEDVYNCIHIFLKPLHSLVSY